MNLHPQIGINMSGIIAPGLKPLEKSKIFIVEVRYAERNDYDRCSGTVIYDANTGG